MVEAILLDKHKIVPCSVFLQGEYGVRDQFVFVRFVLGGSEPRFQLPGRQPADLRLDAGVPFVLGFLVFADRLLPRGRSAARPSPGPC